jgi:hypothetical protein
MERSNEIEDRHRKEIRRVGQRRVARNRRKTRKVMRQRGKARAAFNEAVETFKQRQSVLIPKG